MEGQGEDVGATEVGVSLQAVVVPLMMLAMVKNKSFAPSTSSRCFYQDTPRQPLRACHQR
jgi:hypothetical protein